MLHYLRRHAHEGSHPWPSTRQIVRDAARSGDIEIAETALTILEENHDAQATAVATSMLQDTDPELRQYALLYLGRHADKPLVPTLMKMLDDPEAKVRSLASDDLSIVTHQEFNVHYDADDKTTAAGLASWKNWWKDHQSEFAPPGALPAPAAELWSLSAAVPATDFRPPGSCRQNRPSHRFQGQARPHKLLGHMVPLLRPRNPPTSWNSRSIAPIWSCSASASIKSPTPMATMPL